MTTASTSSTGPQQTRITLDRDPAQLIAAIPHMMGFRPARSVVLIGHRPTEPSVLGWVLRGDLPPAEFEEQQAAEMAQRLALSDAFGVTIVVVGAGPDTDSPAQRLPHQCLVTALTEACAESKLRVLHALWVPEISAAAGWHCYMDTACSGTLPDPASTPLAATMATTGRVTFDSREDLEGLLVPDSAELLARRCTALDAANDRLDGGDRESDGPGSAFESRCGEIGVALRQARSGTLRPDDTQVVALAEALSDVRVRDACLALALPPGSAPAIEAEALWIALVRASPEPERAEPATLLAYSAYLRGDGALARMALHAALKASPDHVLAGLLDRALWKGVVPEQLTGLGRVDNPVDLWCAGEGG